MTTDFIDPVAQPSSYQSMLLKLVGDDDPAAIQAGTPKELRKLIDDAGPHLRTRPAKNEWSVLELVGHIVDAELVVGTRYRFILAHEEPPIQPYDQDLWADHLRHNEADPEELIAPFEALRNANLALWRRTTPEEHARVGMHQERGPESYDLTFRMLAGHDRFHLDQARQTLDQVRANDQQQESR
jgi:hypothetical protein